MASALVFSSLSLSGSFDGSSIYECKRNEYIPKSSAYSFQKTSEKEFSQNFPMITIVRSSQDLECSLESMESLIQKKEASYERSFLLMRDKLAQAVGDINFPSKGEEIVSYLKIQKNRERLLKVKKLHLKDLKLGIIHPILLFFRNLKEVDLSGNNLEFLPDEFATLSSLNILKLSHNNLQTVPDTIDQIAGLEEVYLDHNQISLLPVNFFKLSSLSCCDLSNNNLRDLPETKDKRPGLSSLKALKSLHLQNNSLSELPSDIGELGALRILDCSKNSIESFPDSMQRLSLLDKFNAERNHLKSIPPWVRKLKRVTYLNLSSNDLTVVADEICEMTSLKILDLEKNQIRKLPEQMGSLKFLIWLNVEDNLLTSLPESLHELNSLERLNCSKNSLKKFPIIICLLENLTFLGLNQNDIEEVPRQIGNLRKLEVLFLEKNRIKEMPEDIEKCTQIKVLSLDENPIRTINWVGKLKGLKHLGLRKMQLLEFPLILFTLTLLRRLDVSENPFGEIPDGIEGLKKLRWLNLASTSKRGFEPLTLTSKIGELRLHYLNLNRNHLGSAPSFLGRIKTLQELHLKDNYISMLPGTFASLTSLTALDVSSNRLDETSLDPLQNLRVVTLNLSGNDFFQVPMVLNTFKELKDLNFARNKLSEFNPSFSSPHVANLDLSNNQFRTFPQQVSEIRTLEKFTFLNNRLNRSIPKALLSHRTIKWLNVDFEDFEGIAPHSLDKNVWMMIFSRAVPQCFTFEKQRTEVILRKLTTVISKD